MHAYLPVLVEMGVRNNVVVFNHLKLKKETERALCAL